MKERQPRQISDLREYSLPVLPFVENRDFASTLMLPLLYKDEALGVMVFLSRDHGTLTSRQIEHLKVLGNQSAISIKNSLLHEEIKRMAITDGLTGLFNHKHFHKRLSRELGRFQRTSRPLSLLLMDIDFFKKINDTYGHPAGDEVLRGVAGIVMETIREVDVAARYGGEEFAAVLIDTDKRGAARLAERLRKNIQKTRFEAEGHTISVTASIGISSCGEDAEQTEEIIALADRALYRAKEGGRNRVVAVGAWERS
jgi:diguanylate cyclase (GGDEF)-like protein